MRSLERSAAALWAFVGAVTLIALWEGFVRWRDVAPMKLLPPSQMLSAFRGHAGFLSREHVGHRPTSVDRHHCLAGGFGVDRSVSGSLPPVGTCVATAARAHPRHAVGRLHHVDRVVVGQWHAVDCVLGGVRHVARLGVRNRVGNARGRPSSARTLSLHRCFTPRSAVQAPVAVGPSVDLHCRRESTSGWASERHILPRVPHSRMRDWAPGESGRPRNSSRPSCGRRSCALRCWESPRK